MGDPKFVDQRDDTSGIDRSRTGKIHLRKNGRHAQSGVEESKQRKGGQIDFTRVDVEGPAEEFRLRGKHPVRVDDPLGRTGAAGGEDDCRHVVAPQRHGLKTPEAPAVLDYTGQNGAPWRPTPARADPYPNRPPSPSEYSRRPSGFRNPDEGLRLGLVDTAPEMIPADPRVDEHGDGTQFDQSESHHHHLGAGRHHEHDPGPRADSEPGQTGGAPIAAGLQFSVGQVSTRADQGDLLRTIDRSGGEMSGYALRLAGIRAILHRGTP